MIVGRKVRGAHLITAVDHPESFWAEVERNVGQKLTPEVRAWITAAADGEAETILISKSTIDGTADWTYRGRRLAEFHPYVNDPAAFTRMNLA